MELMRFMHRLLDLLQKRCWAACKAARVAGQPSHRECETREVEGLEQQGNRMAWQSHGNRMANKNASSLPLPRLSLSTSH